MTEWTYAGTSVEGKQLEIAAGVDVWQHEWIPVPREPPPEPTGEEIADMAARQEKAYVTDPFYGSDHEFLVYDIVHRGARIRFAAREFSSRLWGFYVPKEG